MGWGVIFDLSLFWEFVPAFIVYSIDLVAAMLEQPDAVPSARMFPCEIVERGSLRPLP